jgi:hypothetical protein
MIFLFEAISAMQVYIDYSIVKQAEEYWVTILMTYFET